MGQAFSYKTLSFLETHSWLRKKRLALYGFEKFAQSFNSLLDNSILYSLPTDFIIFYFPLALYVKFLIDIWRPCNILFHT